MTQVNMSEPVAYRSKDTPYLFSLGGPGTEGFDGLITTTQAQAYMDACVREALEEAAKVCDEQAMNYERSTENCDGDPTDISELRSKAWVVSNLARRIRFLIPK